MSIHRLEPAHSVIRKIGIAKVAEVTGKHVSRVYRWMYPKENGGTGGLIPQPDARLLLEYARSAGIELSAEDFFVAPSLAKAS